MPDTFLALLLFAATLAFLLLGLWPFRFDFRRRRRLRIWFVRPVNGALNFICFVPFGVVIANLSLVGQPIVAAAAYCGCLSLAVEVLQLFLPGRFGSVSDWLLNTAGGICGAAVAPNL